jgi:hypothetical protein
MRLELEREVQAPDEAERMGGAFSQASDRAGRHTPTLSFTTSDPMCPQCGGDLRRSRLLPHGEDADGAVYMARFCRTEGLMFGRAVDGTWSVPVTGTRFN